jgi:HEAT repeat protein
VQQRSFAALAIGISGSVGAAPRLRQELLAATADRAKGAVAIALGLLRDPRSDAIVADLLRIRSSGELAMHAMWFCALRGNRDAIPLVQRVLEQARVPCVTEAAAAALAVLGATEARPQLLRLMKEGPVEMRCVAATCLGRMGDQAALEPLLAAAFDAAEVDATRAAAVEALGLLAQRAPTPPLARVAIDAGWDLPNDAIEEITRRAGRAWIAYDAMTRRKI